MSDPSVIVWRRRMAGISAILCLVVSGALHLLFPQHEASMAAFLRVGLVTGAFWLAMPTSSRPAAWSGKGLLILPLLVVLAIFVRPLRPLIPWLPVLGFIYWIVRPRSRKG